jgi:two-component system, cell cycle sensor histidine kinase and response regulator CckA
LTLRLLLIEDSAEDAELLVRALRQGNVELTLERVEAEPELRSALKHKWDAVISDFNLPQLDPLHALALVKAADSDLPFIIVSGTMGEDVAVAAMRAGAQDYVMKSSLKRLAETLKREVKEAGLRRERRSLEEQVRQAQKMEAVGQLATSIAHDFNNLLTVILSFSQFAHDDLPNEHPSRQDLREVVECAQRAAGLTRQLLSFSRKTVYDPQLIDVNAVLHASDKMLRRLLGARIDYATLTSQEPAYVVADRGLVEQVVVNLVVNARDAMPAGGKLTVETSVQGERVMIAVTDTGVGMSEQVKARIFEPFFTTKQPGYGTGLGLSTAHGIVKQAGGELSVYSETGRGTTFKVYLPYRAPDASVGARADAPRVVRGTETVLIVEDQDPVREAVQRILTSHGYTVLQAARPGDALQLGRKSTRLDLVLTDLVLPEMNGAELVQQLQSRRPGLRVLYMSGYAGGALTHQGAVEPGATFLQKPFTPDALTHKVRAVLDAHGAK